MNNPEAKDSEIELICETLVDSLFSFLVTTGAFNLVHFSFNFFSFIYKKEMFLLNMSCALYISCIIYIYYMIV